MSNVGRTVVIQGTHVERWQDADEIATWKGFKAEVVEEVNGLNQFYLLPLSDRPDTDGRQRFYWPTIDLEFADNSSIDDLRKTVDSLRAQGYTVKCTVTAPAEAQEI